MSVHPDYPGLVRESLHSDIYWADYRPEGYEVPDVETARPYPGLESSRLFLNKEHKADIYDTFRSITGGATMDPIVDGAPLPRPNDRQLLYVVEDRRSIVSAISLASHFDKKQRARKESAIKAAKTQFGEDIKIAGFEEEIAEIEDSVVYLGSGASDRRRVGRRVSLVLRAGYLLKWDEEASIFVGLQTDDMLFPEIWKSALTQRFPDVPLGKAYSRNVLGNPDELGRLVSGNLLEVHTLKPDFKNTLGGNSKPKKKEKAPLAARFGQVGLNGIG